MIDSNGRHMASPAPWPDPTVRCGQQVGAGALQPLMMLKDEVQPLVQVSRFPGHLLLTTGGGGGKCAPKPAAVEQSVCLWGALGTPGWRCELRLVLITEGLAWSL